MEGLHVRLPLALAVAALAAAGCLQLETTIRLHEDGSATVTERLQFTKALLDLSSDAAKKDAKLDITALLTKEVVAERVKQMGKGVTLVSHTMRDAENGAKESVTVIQVADISEFRYVSPYLAAAEYPKHTVMKCTLFPVYESTWWGRRAGEMGVSFQPVTAEPDRGKREPPPPPSPRDQQVLRDLRPVFADLMKDLEVRFTFESYAPLRFRMYYRYRNMSAKTRSFDLLDFSDKSMDKYGYDFVGNEEIMLELLRCQMGGANIVDHVSGHAGNMTLPVYHPSGTPEIYFRPSRTLFDKYFPGKTLKFDRNEGGERPAKFEEIGYTPPATGGKEGK